MMKHFVVLLLMSLSISTLLTTVRGFSTSDVQHTWRKMKVTESRPLNRRQYHRQIDMSYKSILESGIAVAAVVAIHEAGHFIAARSFDMKIDSYNVGYGPKLLAFNETYKGGDLEYALRAFPFGGYVAFPSNVNYDDGKGNELTEPVELDDPDLLQNRPAFQRGIVISAGVVANILLAWSLASFTASTTGLSHPIFAPGVQVTGSPAAGIKASYTHFTLDYA